MLLNKADDQINSHNDQS